ncbi:CysJI operon transcriptional activator [Algoriella xinjiangensis]|uniref:LysR family transcriptional regulator n=1 Tax=Algoriella xinjiangensis TaxID=684065 RepID=UPI000F64472D|nr:LysR family transcriptional regulator [Algoriella xinjiangensis]VDH15484.1 CysJI operon transcriptional activator [Algoriella xinjiangensis]
MVNLEWYRTFIAIYQQGNLTKAAQEISISQPNASVHLAALEQYVGGKLFDRMPRKMVPTEMGRGLYTQVIGSVENLMSVEMMFTRKTLDNRSVLRVGTPIEFFYSKASSQLTKLSSHLHVTFGVAKDLINDLSEGNLDFVIASQKITENRQLVFEPILTENFILVGNPDLDLSTFENYLKNEKYIEVENWLMSQNWFAYSSDLAYIRRFWLSNFNKRPMIVPKYIIPNMNVIIKAISEGNGISIVSDFLANEFIESGKIKKIWSGKIPAANELYLAYDKSKTSQIKVEEILKIFTDNK